MSRSKKRRYNGSGMTFGEFVKRQLREPYPASVIISGNTNGRRWSVYLRVYRSPERNTPIVHYQGKEGMVPCSRLPRDEVTVRLEDVAPRPKRRRTHSLDTLKERERDVAAALNSLSRHTHAFVRAA